MRSLISIGRNPPLVSCLSATFDLNGCCVLVGHAANLFMCDLGYNYLLYYWIKRKKRKNCVLFSDFFFSCLLYKCSRIIG